MSEMRIAVIADIHSNLHALKALQEELRAERPDAVVCAGDIVGYGAFPNECTAEVRNMCAHTVFGNHEQSVLAQSALSMNPYAAAAARWTWEHITADTRGFLSSLPLGARFPLAGRRPAMFHGSVDSAVEYVFEEDVTEHLLEEADADILVLGHTHSPYVRRFPSGTVLNPGSVGQPRDGDPRGSYSVIDSKGDCSIRRFDYDIEAAADAIEDAGLPSVLAERLFLGR